MARACFYILIGHSGLLVGCSNTQRETTPAAIVPAGELQSVLESGAFADISDPSRGNDTVALPRIPHKIDGTFEEGYLAAFMFGGEERRIESESGRVSVLTDGEECIVVDEKQCGTPVRITKIDQAGDIVFEFSEYHHAHSRVCVSLKHALVFVYILDLAEVRAYAWADCALRFTITLPHSQPPLLVVSDSEDYLYVEHSKESIPTGEVVVRKYAIADLL